MTTDDRSIQISDLANALRQVMDPTLKERLSLQERPPGAPHVRIPCVSPTGATFDAVVASSKAFPHFGRVRGLENYKYPETFFFGERDGIGNAVPSKVIDGKTREFNGKRQDLTPPQRMALTKKAGPVARAFYAYLQQPDARAVLRRHGFTVPSTLAP